MFSLIKFIIKNRFKIYIILIVYLIFKTFEFLNDSHSNCVNNVTSAFGQVDDNRIRIYCPSWLN